MRVSVIGAAAFSLSLLLAAAPGQAQAPAPPAAPQAPLPGFMTPHEIAKVVRSAGFDPLAPPLREGTTYVLRATDFRGVLMRVVVDAHSGAIRAVNRIVPGPGSYGPIGMVPPPYGSPDIDGSELAPSEEGAAPPVPAPATHTAAHPLVSPPLPRPRPAALALHKPAADATHAAKSDGTSAVTAAPIAPNKPAQVPLND